MSTTVIFYKNYIYYSLDFSFLNKLNEHIFKMSEWKNQIEEPKSEEINFHCTG
ncbi:MAG: hypothetical protein BAJALOKI2v1_240043 [Promethearchaeota archaeon]|nr:MAG: hypothetical protein BAJALOKI2v1_240043 [Candidatus Lokiarchaeota archaeon]